ncbi:MAG: endo alpha-1,4 polygalactosaminidase [Solirubrobacteraceae bacterium]
MGAQRRGWSVTLAVITLCLAASAIASPAVARTRWVLPAHLTWYWQLQGRVRIEPVDASDIDGFDTTAAEVARLHARGQHVICYVDVGTWERWRPDAGRFPAAVRGKGNGWPGERWLDVRRPSVLEPIMRARFAMCAHKGFDAVEPDNMDGFENPTGFAIRPRQQLAYDDWVARGVHALGMAVLEKNDPEQARQLEPHFDGVLDEQCNQYTECGAFRPYLRAGKPVLNAEYKRSLYPQFCANDRRLGISGALYALQLDGTLFEPCAVNPDSLRL